jgi:transglutaminase-like putative cysteine protease
MKMKLHHIIIATIITTNLPGCNKEPAPKENEAQPDSIQEPPQKWLKIPKNWDHDQQLIEQLTSIGRLEKEAHYDDESESHGDDQIELIERVTTIDDPKIIGPLIDSLATVSGTKISDTLAKFGEQSLKLLIEKYNKTQNADLQNGIIFTIEQIIKKNASTLTNNKAASSVYQELKTLLLKGLKNPDPFTRESAIIALTSLGDSLVIPHLEQIAKNDDYNIRGGGEGSELAQGTIIYPLREMAQKAIDTLKATTPASSPVPINQNYAEIKKHVSQTPASAELTVKTLANYLIKPAKTQTERAYAIYYWLTQNLAYDTQSFFSGHYGDLTPADVLRSRKAICSGYSRLFTGLAKPANLEIVEIIGISKSYGFSEKGTLGAHAWNAVKIDNQWRLLDATWGAGFVTKSGEFEKELEDFYFFTPPEQFIYSHFPKERQWQLLDPTISKTEFKKLVYLRPAFFKYGLALDSHQQSQIKIKDRLTLSLLAPDNVIFLTGLTHKQKKLEDTLTFHQRDGERLIIKAVFPYQGIFRLNVFAKDKTETGNYPSVLEYTVQATQTPVGAIGLPKTYAAFNTVGAYLHSPMTYHIKSGEASEFQIKIPGAIKVALIDDNGWHYLDKQPNDIFSGIVSVKGKISLSAKLEPEPNNYATIVEFLAE